jgi:hypothetical protein
MLKYMANSSWHLSSNVLKSQKTTWSIGFRLLGAAFWGHGFVNSCPIKCASLPFLAKKGEKVGGRRIRFAMAWVSFEAASGK